jgi:putative endonuclease
LGRRGEQIACRLLRERGLEILMQNYRSAWGEIDIVARDGQTLCFVEVKTRQSAVFSRPADAVTRTKRRRIIRTAWQYRRELGHPPILHRFDIVELVIDNRRILEASHLPDAFTESS